MKFKVSSELSYAVRIPTTLIFNIQALRAKHQTILEETLFVEPFFRPEELNSSFHENRFLRVEVDKPSDFTISYSATVDTTYQEVELNESVKSTTSQLNGDILPYLFPSRYCQSDKLFRLAKDKFGTIPNAYEKVKAITEWIHDNVEYTSGSTNSQTSAHDTVIERTGVCRDFAHLGISLCRALTIPARYFTGYAYQLNPPDFHACFEAYLAGRWILFDATKLAPLNGLVKIGSAKDAAGAAVTNIFGNVQRKGMKISCEALEEFQPYFYHPDKMVGIAY